MEELNFQKLCESAGPVLVDDLDYNYDDLEHAGIIGMRWGKRRYQNDDGTYTELGKERRRKYGGMSRAEKKAAKKAKKKADEAREAKKERTDAVKRGDIRYAQVNFDKFSEDEIAELYRRYDMKQEINRLNTQKSQETLDKWVNRFNSAGKMAVSIDTIYSSLNDISEKSKDNKAAEKRRKNEAKKAKLLLDEQQLRNDSQRTRNKVEEENYKRMLEETKDYRDKLREYDLDQKRLSNEKLNADVNKSKADFYRTKADFYRTKAETQKTVQETRNSKSKALREYDDWKYEYDKKTAKATVADPYAAKEYQDQVEKARSGLESKLDKQLKSKYRYAKDSSAVESEKARIEKEAEAFVKKYSPNASKADIQSEIDYRINRFDNVVNEQKRNYYSERSEKIAKIDAELPLSYVSYLNSGGTPFTSSADSDKQKSQSKDIKEMKERIDDLEKMLKQ